MIVSLLFVGASALWLYLPLRRALADAPHREPLAIFGGLGLSLGALSILMMWIGLAPIPLLIPPLVLAIPIIGVAASLPEAIKVFKTLKVSILNYKTLLLFICAISIFVIGVNSISYPFYRFDTITRFAPNARAIFTRAQIPTSLTGYPLGIQMLYTFGFMAAGAVNDHVAGIYVALMALGMAGVVYLSTRLMFSERAAWCATILALSSPALVDWATSGYVDVAEGFYHGLTFIFALLWLRQGKMRDAILAGVMCGLSLWVKHSSLVLIPALAVVPLLRIATTFPAMSLQKIWREVLLGIAALIALSLIGFPWFARSYLLGQTIFPAPSTFDELFIDRSFSALITFWNRRDEWGLPLGLSVLAGFAVMAVAFIKPSWGAVAASPVDRYSLILLLAFVIPYHLIWWWQFTYQVRYLFASLPMYAALAGYAVDWLLDRVRFKIPIGSAGIVAFALILFGAYPRLGAVYHLVRDPFQSDDVKLTRLAGAEWTLAKRMREVAKPNAKILSMDGALLYWLYGYDEFASGYPTKASDLRNYDYLITAPWGKSVNTALGQNPDDLYAALNDPSRFVKLYDGGDNWAIYEVKLK